MYEFHIFIITNNELSKKYQAKYDIIGYFSSKEEGEELLKEKGYFDDLQGNYQVKTRHIKGKLDMFQTTSDTVYKLVKRTKNSTFFEEVNPEQGLGYFYDKNEAEKEIGKHPNCEIVPIQLNSLLIFSTVIDVHHKKSFIDLKPKVFDDNQKEIICCIRGKKVENTPEEQARQILLENLLRKGLIPKNEMYVKVEKTLYHNRYRHDVRINNAQGQIVILIECKPDDTNLSESKESLWKQVNKYIDKLSQKPDYVVVANRIHYKVKKLATGEYLSEIPNLDFPDDTIPY